MRTPKFVVIASTLLIGATVFAQANDEPPKVSRSPIEMSDLQKKAESGDAKAQLELGKAYEKGDGVQQNEEIAAGWIRKAAEQGNAAAQNELGIMYRTGTGVNKDKEEAVK